MGKSLGNTLEPKDLVARFGQDAVRYYFLKEIEFGKDGDFSEERFTNIVNANLANTIGETLPTISLQHLVLFMVLLIAWRDLLALEIGAFQSHFQDTRVFLCPYGCVSVNQKMCREVVLKR